MGDREKAPAIIAASYERVSTRAQGQHGFSLGAQHQSLDDFARAQGWVLPEHLRFRDGEDENASGADWDLPGLTAMLAAASRREFQVLAVPDFDRFARSMVKGLVLEEQLKKHGVRVAFQRVPVEDTPEGNLLKTQLYAFAEYDRQMIILRTMMGRRAKAGVGKVVGVGRPPYGYRFTRETLPNGKVRVCGLEPEPSTAMIARDILHALQTRSTLDVAADLNERGIPGPTGKPWNAQALYQMGQSTVYVGEWQYAGITVPVEPIVDRSVRDDIQTAFRHRAVARRGRQPVEDDPFLLRGMLMCGHCHGVLRTANPNRRRYYRCARHTPGDARLQGKPVCSLPVVRAEDLETELRRILTETLLDPDRLAAGLAAAKAQRAQADLTRQDRIDILDVETAKQRKRLQAMVDELIDAGPATKDAIRQRMSELEKLIGRLDSERAELSATRSEGLSDDDADAITAFADEVRTGIDRATPADRRQLYELLQVRGTVYADSAGIKLGRTQRFRIDWRAAIQLASSDKFLL